MSDFNQNPFDNGQSGQTEPNNAQQPVNQTAQQTQPSPVQPMGGQFAQPGAPVSQPSVSPEMAADVSAAETVNGAEVVKKKSKKGLFIGLAASLAVIVGGSCAAYAFSPWVKNNVKMLINDPAEYYAWVEEENFNTIADEVSKAYGSSLENTKQEAQLEITAELNGENIDKLLEETEGMSLSSLGIEIPSEISVKVGSKYEKDAPVSVAQIAAGDDSLVDMYMYMIDGNYYYQIPELSSSYVAMDIDEMFSTAISELGSDEAAIMQAYVEILSDMTDDPSALGKLISEDDIKDIILNYSSAVYSKIGEVELEKGVERKVDDVTMEYNVLTAELDEKCLYDILMNALETAEDDKTVMGICEKFGLEKDAYKDAVSSLIDELEGEEDDIGDGDDYVEMNVYVSSTGSICGREFTYINGEGDEEGKFMYLVAEEDDEKFGVEVSLEVEDEILFTLEGGAEKKSDKCTGEVVFKVTDGSETVEVPLSFKNIQTAGDEDQYLKGEVTFDLSKLGLPSITLELDSDGKGQTLKTDAVVAGTDYGSLAFTVSEKMNLEVPEFDSSQTVYWFDETGSGMEGYAEEIQNNLTGFLNKIGEAVGYEGLGDNYLALMEMGSEDEYYDDEYYDDEYDYEDDYEDFDSSDIEATCDFSKLTINLNGTPVTIPSKIDGILSYVDVTDETIEPYYTQTYYDEDYSVSVTLENDTDAPIAPADCSVVGLSVYEGSPLSMSINGVTVGSSVSDIESVFGVTIDNVTDDYITITDSNSEWNTMSFYWYEGTVYMIDVYVY